jgi:GNAT superfamily N-acetyltransferase
MIEIFGEDRKITLPFCIGQEEDVTLFACVDGHMGRIWTDTTDKPTCAIALIGDFYFFLGNYIEVKEKEILEIIEKFCKGKIIMVEGKQWEPMLKRLKERYSDTFKSFPRYAMKGRLEWFNQEKLKEYAVAIEPEFEALRIDDRIYPRTQEQFWTADFCSNFLSQEDYKKHGIGYVILQNDEIIAGASTYSYCDGKLEITIETKEEFRKKGLGLACASKIILECISRNIYPRWDAANMASVALAEKLGYRYSHEYTVYMV